MATLLDLVSDAVFGTDVLALSVEATVTPPGESAVTTNVVWMVPTMDDAPVDAAFARREIRRVIAMRTDEVATCPRGTIINCPETPGGAASDWRVDGVDVVEANHRRVIVIPEPS